MTTPTTIFDGLLDDDTPTTLTAREQVDAQLEPDDAARTPVVSANPDDEAEMTTDLTPATVGCSPQTWLKTSTGSGARGCWRVTLSL